MKAEIISIGTEILLGEITNTNATYLAGQLPLLGLDLNFMVDVGDNQQRLVDSLRQAWQRSDVVICTGGLGPTQDDLTRESIAELMGETMAVDPALLETVNQFFIRINREMSSNNRKQATLIPSARAILNERGTAPGWWVEKDGKILISMPGPPPEMQYMWTKHVFPELQRRLGSSIIASKTIKAFGLGEGSLDQMIEHLIKEKNPSVGVYAKYDGIHLRITAKADTLVEAKKLIARKETELRTVLDQYIWGSDDDTIEDVVESILVEQNKTVATMEYQTGGFIANTLTNTQNNEKVFGGGMVANSRQSMESLGVDSTVLQKHGLISCETAAAMAVAARKQFGSTIGMGIAAVVGNQAEEGKQSGTAFICIDDGTRKKDLSLKFAGQRQQIKQRSAVAALVALKQFLHEENRNAASHH